MTELPRWMKTLHGNLGKQLKQKQKKKKRKNEVMEKRRRILVALEEYLKSI